MSDSLPISLEILGCTFWLVHNASRPGAMPVPGMLPTAPAGLLLLRYLPFLVAETAPVVALSVCVCVVFCRISAVCRCSVQLHRQDVAKG